MGDPSVEEDVSDQLPKKIFSPNQNRDEPKVETDTVAYHHLEEKKCAHNDHQFFNNRCQTISK
jgi:hypothetical protein